MIKLSEQIAKDTETSESQFTPVYSDPGSAGYQDQQFGREGHLSYVEPEKFDAEDLKNSISEFEEYRNPLEYSKDLWSDVKLLVSKTKYGESGLEAFDSSKEKSQMAAIYLLKTNFTREIIYNGAKHKPKGPMWDIAGATWGALKGAKMEFEDRDIKSRIEGMWKEIRED